MQNSKRVAGNSRVLIEMPGFEFFVQIYVRVVYHCVGTQAEATQAQ